MRPVRLNPLRQLYAVLDAKYESVYRKLVRKQALLSRPEVGVPTAAGMAGLTVGTPCDAANLGAMRAGSG